MNKHPLIYRFRKTAYSSALALLMICGLLAALAPGATAAVELLYFRATAGSDKILVEWETASEQDVVGFNLYRSQDNGSKGQRIGDTFPNQGDGFEGAKYSYPDTDVLRGVRYYYSLEEIAASGGLRVIEKSNAGIDMPPLTPAATASATATRSPTATVSATATRPPASAATNVPGGSAGDPPTATRQFTLTPEATATAAEGSTPTPPPPAPATATPIGVAVVSTPTGGPQPPAEATVAPPAVPETITPLPATAPPAPPTPSSSPEIVAMSTLQPALELTPTATPPPQVFAAATAQPLLGTPGRAAAEPTPVPAGEASRATGSMLLLGGGAILLAAAIGGGVLLYLRSRRS
jgi:hypothetical protein